MMIFMYPFIMSRHQRNMLISVLRLRFQLRPFNAPALRPHVAYQCHTYHKYRDEQEDVDRFRVVVEAAVGERVET